MDQVCSLSSRRSALSVPLVALALVGFVGCDAETPRAVALRPPATTPEEKLDLALERLQAALVDAAAAQGTGVVSERSATHRLIRPQEEGEPYRAEVTIRTTRALAKAAAAATLPKKEEEKTLEEILEEPVEDAEGVEGEAIEEFTPDESEETEEVVEDVNPDNGVTRRAIEQSRETQTKTYELVYQRDRWQLASKIGDDDEVAKYLFEYALSP